MDRTIATKLLRTELDKHGLTNWKLRLSSDQRFLGLCSYKDKVIFLNMNHIDIHPEEIIRNTILHEIAHALVGVVNGHNEIWEAKAKEIGCIEIRPCASVGLPAHIIDAIRSGDTVETEVVTETIQKVKYTVGKLTDKCPECGKVAKEKSSFEVDETKYILLECGHLITKAIPKSTPFHTLTTEPENGKICKHEWDKNTCVLCNANKPFPFQVEGMKFIERGLALQRGVGIFDEMGLGKTIQALGYIKFHPESCPVLYVVKSGIKYQWYMQILRWLGIKYLPQVLETGKDGIIPNLRSYIISYDLLRRFDTSKLEKIGIKTVILDECQLIKNPDSTRTGEVRKVVKLAQHVIPLSGTPWKNRGEEFFVALNMLDALKFDSFERYKHRWVDYYYDGPRLKQGGIKNVKAFKEYTKDLIIRRERVEVMPELPLVNRVKLYCQMEEHANEAYQNEVNEFVKFYNNAVIGGEEGTFESAQGILARLARMRQITGLAKIPVTLEDIEEFFDETDRKLAVFVHHVAVGKLLVDKARELDVIREKGIKVLTLTADMNSEQRYQVQEEFNNTPQILMIGSTLASGEGLNLQSCSDCIMHERQWNPANEEQAEGRFIRIGQKAQSVTAKYALAIDTVDDILDGIVARKRIAFNAAMNKGEITQWNQQSIIKELSESIVKMANNKKGK
jgi:hypothetical protein